MRPFLLITTREDQVSAGGEVQLYRTLTGLTTAGLVSMSTEHSRLDQLSPTHFSGVIIAGSPYTHTDAQTQKSPLQRSTEQSLALFMQRILHERVPFLGVCYGLGALARSIGAPIDRSYPEKSGVAAITVTPQAHQDPLFRSLPPVFDAFVGHKECVPRLPANAIILATSEHSPIQAVRYRENAYATQFHPELTVAAFQQRVNESAAYGYFEPAEMADILESAHRASVGAAHRILKNFVTLFGTGVLSG